MRLLIAFFLMALTAGAQQLPPDDAARIAEFYRFAGQIQDSIWPQWSKTPAPLLLVTPSTEFLTHFPAPPKGFEKVGDGLYARPRQFAIHFLATFPAVGLPAAIVIGEPQNTEAKTSTPWLITVMHEHFHQLQDAQPGYFDAVAKLDLSGGDKTGMWMLNYAFPYGRPTVARGFARLRDLLLAALAEPDQKKFNKLAQRYGKERRKWFARLSPRDARYFSFQLWQEGMARYTQIKVAEAAAGYQPSAEFAALADYEPFAKYAARAGNDTLAELKQADLAQWKRVVVYSFGAAEGLLLDRWKPEWKEGYFKHPLSTEMFFAR